MLLVLFHEREMLGTHGDVVLRTQVVRQNVSKSVYSPQRAVPDLPRLVPRAVDTRIVVEGRRGQHVLSLMRGWGDV